jgi:hypothetical protein
MSGGEVGMMVFEPGWRWSSDAKPIDWFGASDYAKNA